jgi:hypothetical protein
MLSPSSEDGDWILSPSSEDGDWILSLSSENGDRIQSPKRSVLKYKQDGVLE